MFTGDFYSISNPDLEGPAMFKRNGMYYIFAGVGCCACKGGSNIDVFTSKFPIGPFEFQSDVGSNLTHFWNPWSPYNYVTRAQQSKVFPVKSVDGIVQWIWLGNQWVTSSEVGIPRNNDLLYFDLLQFNTENDVQQFIRKDSIIISVPN